MKKSSIFSIILLISGLICQASPVSQQQARKVAMSYMNCSSVTLSCDSFSITGTKASGVDAPAFYIFNNPGGGWVIISGDDATIPVLAANGSGEFGTSDMPGHLKYWLSRMSGKVKDIRSDAALKQSSHIKALWENPRPSAMNSGTSQVYLVTPSWNQYEPYNNKCPYDKSGNKTITGCVATAMAEILEYNRYPKKGTGTIPAYTTSQSISMSEIDISSHTYDWDIPYVYSSVWTAQQKDAVSTLMLHCGCMVNMNYGSAASGGSSASSSSIPSALSTYMGYSKATCERFREEDAPDKWLNMLKAEIDAGRPMIYSGQDISGNGGHAFVLDGYDSDNKIHINWGWSGTCDGWFAINYLGPVLSKGYIFSTWDSAIIGLVPDEEGTSVQTDNPKLFISVCIADSQWSTPRGFSITRGSIEANDFDVSIDALWNYSGYTYEGQIKVCLADIQENIICDLSGTFSISCDNTVYFSDINITNCAIPTGYSPKLGDHIALYYNNPKGEWFKADCHFQVNALKTLDKLNPFDFSIITIPSTISAGNIVYPDVVHRNVRLSAVEWKLDDESLEGNSFNSNGRNNVRFTASSGEHTLQVKLSYTDGSSEVVRKKFTVL